MAYFRTAELQKWVEIDAVEDGEIFARQAQVRGETDSLAASEGIIKRQCEGEVRSLGGFSPKGENVVDEEESKAGSRKNALLGNPSSNKIPR